MFHLSLTLFQPEHRIFILQPAQASYHKSKPAPQSLWTERSESFDEDWRLAKSGHYVSPRILKDI